MADKFCSSRTLDDHMAEGTRFVCVCVCVCVCARRKTRLRNTPPRGGHAHTKKENRKTICFRKSSWKHNIYQHFSFEATGYETAQRAAPQYSTTQRIVIQ